MDSICLENLPKLKIGIKVNFFRTFVLTTGIKNFSTYSFMKLFEIIISSFDTPNEYWNRSILEEIRRKFQKRWNSL